MSDGSTLFHNDFLGVAVPFKKSFLASVTVDGVGGTVDLSHIPGLRFVQNLDFDPALDKYVISDLRHSHQSFECLQSFHSGLAVKIDVGSSSRLPCVQLKASPAKLINGHNVWGWYHPNCFWSVFEVLNEALPDLFEMLDIENSEINLLDYTFSFKSNRPDLVRHILSQCSTIQHKRLTPYKKFQYENTIYWNKASEHGFLKLYCKHYEMLERIRELKRENINNRYDNQLRILSCPKLLEYSRDILRLEARLTNRKLKALEVPTNFIEFIKYFNQQASLGRNLAFDLFMHKAAPFFEAIKGEDMKNYSDEKIEHELVKVCMPKKVKTANGSYIEVVEPLSRRQINAVLSTYRQIIHLGYDKLHADLSSRSRLCRHLQILAKVGISKAELQAIHNSTQKGCEVISIAQFFKPDLNASAPDYLKSAVVHDFLAHKKAV